MRTPSSAGWFAAWLVLNACVTGCGSNPPLPQTDSFTAGFKATPELEEGQSLTQPQEAEPPKDAQKYTAHPKQKPGQGDRKLSDQGRGPSGAMDPTPVVEPVGDLEIHFIKVGQGDSTLLKLPNGTTVLIDGGSLKERKPKDLKDYLEAEVEDGSVDTLVVTHPDADHYNYLPYAISGLTVGQVLLVGTSDEYAADANVSSSTSQAAEGFSDWLGALPSDKRIRLTTADVDDQDDPSNALFDSGEVKIWIVAADVKDGTDKNSRSIVLLVSYGDFDCLLTGDATFKTETAITGKYDAWWLDVECLKLGHHGSKWTSSSDAWIGVVQPEVAVASASYASMHGHPHNDIRAKVEARTMEASPHRIKWWTSSTNGVLHGSYTEAVYSTATNGTIVITTDGSSFDVDYTN